MFRRDLPPAVRQAVEELRQSLARLYGERYAGLYLYGSYARGDFREESDVDLLLLLKGAVNSMAELNRLSEMLSDLCLRHDVLIAVYPVPEEWLTVRKSPLFENVRREGVAL
jgi:predicted nucleotidyltransferase